jgi:serine/threonine protein phosphatase 1
MAGRTVAIGDIHGCPDALTVLIDAVAPSPDDTVVLLGDYIDRGPDSRGVLVCLIDLARRCRLVRRPRHNRGGYGPVRDGVEWQRSQPP